jgi:hypothetical protein
MQHDNDALRQEVKRLDAEVRSLRAWGDDLRKSVEDPSPRCNRPTRAGTPCKARAITYPMPIESCQIHLTTEERKALDAKEQERNRQWEQRLAEQSQVREQESLRQVIRQAARAYGLSEEDAEARVRAALEGAR